MAIDIYKGKYVTAESATKYIDSEEIIKECDILKETSEKLSQTSKKIINSKYYCTKDKFSIQQDTMEEKIENCGKEFKDTSLYIEDLIETLLVSTQKALDKKQLDLNSIAKIEDEKLIRLETEEVI